MAQRVFGRLGEWFERVYPAKALALEKDLVSDPDFQLDDFPQLEQLLQEISDHFERERGKNNRDILNSLEKTFSVFDRLHGVLLRIHPDLRTHNDLQNKLQDGADKQTQVRRLFEFYVDMTLALVRRNLFRENAAQAHDFTDIAQGHMLVQKLAQLFSANISDFKSSLTHYAINFAMVFNTIHTDENEFKRAYFPKYTQLSEIRNRILEEHIKDLQKIQESKDISEEERLGFLSAFVACLRERTLVLNMSFPGDSKNGEKYHSDNDIYRLAVANYAHKRMEPFTWLYALTVVKPVHTMISTGVVPCERILSLLLEFTVKFKELCAETEKSQHDATSNNHSSFSRRFADLLIKPKGLLENLYKDTFPPGYFDEPTEEKTRSVEYRAYFSGRSTSYLRKIPEIDKAYHPAKAPNLRFHHILQTGKPGKLQIQHFQWLADLLHRRIEHYKSQGKEPIVLAIHQSGLFLTHICNLLNDVTVFNDGTKVRSVTDFSQSLNSGQIHFFNRLITVIYPLIDLRKYFKDKEPVLIAVDDVIKTGFIFKVAVSYFARTVRKPTKDILAECVVLYKEKGAKKYFSVFEFDIDRNQTSEEYEEGKRTYNYRNSDDILWTSFQEENRISKAIEELLKDNLEIIRQDLINIKETGNRLCDIQNVMQSTPHVAYLAKELASEIEEKIKKHEKSSDGVLDVVLQSSSQFGGKTILYLAYCLLREDSMGGVVYHLENPSEDKSQNSINSQEKPLVFQIELLKNDLAFAALERISASGANNSITRKYFKAFGELKLEWKDIVGEPSKSQDKQYKWAKFVGETEIIPQIIFDEE